MRVFLQLIIPIIAFTITYFAVVYLKVAEFNIQDLQNWLPIAVFAFVHTCFVLTLGKKMIQ